MVTTVPLILLILIIVLTAGICWYLKAKNFRNIFLIGAIVGLLVSTPCLVSQNQKDLSTRRQELRDEIEKIRSHGIESTKMIVRDRNSMLIDSLVTSENFNNHLRGALLNLPNNSAPSSRRAWRKEIELFITTTAKEQLALGIYVFDDTALVIIKTKSMPWADMNEGYGFSDEIKQIFEQVTP